ncbi:MAG: hypothetical protein U1E73_02285 [Planctomycetota bacterium]
MLAGEDRYTTGIQRPFARLLIRRQNASFMGLSVMLRQLRLDHLCVRRQLGAWPWLMLVAWAFFCGGQEPRFLRATGINLCWHGTESGAAILLLAASSLGGPADRREPLLLRLAVISSISWCLLLGFAQAALAWLVDAATGPLPPFASVPRSALVFVAAWMPATLGCTLAARSLAVAFWLRILVLLPLVAFSLGLSTLSSGVQVAPIAASGLACAGILITLAGPRLPARPHINPHS